MRTDTATVNGLAVKIYPHEVGTMNDTAFFTGISIVDFSDQVTFSEFSRCIAVHLQWTSQRK